MINLKDIAAVTKTEFIGHILTIHDETTVKQFEDIYRAKGLFKDPITDFDILGYKYDVHYLKKARSYVAFLPVQLVSNFAHAHVVNFLTYIKPHHLIPFLIDNYNNYHTDNIGNIAFIYCNHKDKEVTKKAKNILHNLIEYEIEIAGLNAHFKQVSNHLKVQR